MSKTILLIYSNCPIYTDENRIIYCINILLSITQYIQILTIESMILFQSSITMYIVITVDLLKCSENNRIPIEHWGFISYS